MDKERLQGLINHINNDVMKHMKGLGVELGPYVDEAHIESLTQAIADHATSLTHQVVVMASLSDFELVEEITPEPEMPVVTRFEFIGKHGREIVKRGKFKISMQDNDLTLKVFEEK